MIALIVYTTRVGGYLLGLQLRRLGGFQSILEALPGCAFMAILVPAARQGNAIEIAAMLCVLGLMWKTNSVVIATLTGIFVLLFGEPALNAIGIHF